MKFVCLGYYDEKQFETLSEKKQNAFMDECFTLPACRHPQLNVRPVIRQMAPRPAELYPAVCTYSTYPSLGNT